MCGEDLETTLTQFISVSIFRTLNTVTGQVSIMMFKILNQGIYKQTSTLRRVYIHICIAFGPLKLSAVLSVV